MHKDISIANPIVRLPREFIKHIEPDQRKKKVKVSFVLSDSKNTITIRKVAKH